MLLMRVDRGLSSCKVSSLQRVARRNTLNFKFYSTITNVDNSYTSCYWDNNNITAWSVCSFGRIVTKSVYVCTGQKWKRISLCKKVKEQQ
eukprot:m.201629 g.201629  ORF g.201629 m.201629 type:complete len:90 (+) comp15746_c0_seq7:1816-2085(+)